MALTEDQKLARSTTIGASDIPKLAKLSRFGGPLSVYREKVDGFDAGLGSEPAEIGTDIEPFIATLFTKRTGIQLVHPVGTITHAKFAWATCTPDRLEAASGIPVELKNVGPNMMRDWDEHDEEGVPDDYRAQVLWQVEILRSHGERLDSGRIAALLGGNKFRAFRVAWDQGFVDDLLAIGHSFVVNHLRPKTPPPLEGNEEIAAWLKKQYPLHSNEITPAPIETLAWAEELHHTREAIRELTERKEELEVLFKATINARLGISGEWGEATWKTRAGSTKWRAVAEGMRDHLHTVVSNLTTQMPAEWARLAGNEVRDLFERLQQENKSEGGRTFLFKYDDGTKRLKAQR